MSVKFKDLGVNLERVREFINTPQGTIEIYEPTIDVIAQIIDMQKEMGFGVDGGSYTVSFDGADVINKLFPLLTNIDLGDLTEDEVQEILDNPSVHLLLAQQYVAQIVHEANKVYAERIKTELKTTDSLVAQMDLVKALPSMILERAKGDGNVAELVEKVNRIDAELVAKIEEENTKVENEESKA